MVALFREKSPANIVWLVILSVAMHATFFVQPVQIVASPQDGFISIALLYIKNYVPAVALIFLYQALIISQALRLNYLLGSFRMFNRPNFLVAMVYILLTGLIPAWSLLSAPLISNTLIIWLFGKLCRLYNNHHPKTLLFNIGFITGLCILGYHPLALLVAITLFGVLLLRAFNLAEIFILLVGFVTTFYFLGVILYLSGNWSKIVGYLPAWDIHFIKAKPDVQLLTTLITLVLILLLGLAFWQQNARRMLIQMRKNWGVLLVLLLILLPAPFINKNAQDEVAFLWLVPIAAFGANMFLYARKKWLVTLLFWIIFFLCIYNNWIQIFNSSGHSFQIFR